MIRNILIALFIFYFGIRVGLNMRTKRIDAKIANLVSMADYVKQRNNDMVENISKVYEMSHPNTNEFTEVDQMLLDMWMD